MTVQHLFRDPLLLVLVVTSLVSWVIILDRLPALLRAASGDRHFQRGASAPDSPLSQLRAVFDTHTGIRGEQLLIVMDTAITLQRQRLERGLALLGVIGSTAPYAGLLGTVIGIIQAFQAIQAHNNMSPAVVSGGIATALIATAIGLGVAIPAVAAHHLLSAAITRRVAAWEATVALWLPADATKEAHHESVTIG